MLLLTQPTLAAQKTSVWNNQALHCPTHIPAPNTPPFSVRSMTSHAGLSLLLGWRKGLSKDAQRLLRSPKSGNSSTPALSEHPVHHWHRGRAGWERGTSRRAVGTAGTVASGRGRRARLLPRAGCVLAPQSPWPPASQPFPGNLIAAADEPKMHFLPPCCNFFIFFLLM